MPDMDGKRRRRSLHLALGFVDQRIWVREELLSLLASLLRHCFVCLKIVNDTIKAMGAFYENINMQNLNLHQFLYLFSRKDMLFWLRD